ncbi:hypothetical protein [Herbaspirillum autotrophicum]|uniref:hypothetical protein n=1 Tax=Herbaspirillum autotrophicum TaxID=180195 RepID=UPI00067E3333|nr:hypothetical protein [Herbaspirillum autotrophicum]
MKAAYPLGAALGLSIIGVILMTAPVRDDTDNERYAKQQQAAKLKANKRLFDKLYVQAEEMTFPVAAYGSKDK